MQVTLKIGLVLDLLDERIRETLVELSPYHISIHSLGRPSTGHTNLLQNLHGQLRRDSARSNKFVERVGQSHADATILHSSVHRRPDISTMRGSQTYEDPR